MNESNQINDWPNWNNICPRLQNIFVWCVWSGRVLWWQRDGASHQNQVRTWLGNPSSSDFLLILFVFVNVFICVFDCVCICILCTDKTRGALTVFVFFFYTDKTRGPLTLFVFVLFYPHKTMRKLWKLGLKWSTLTNKFSKKAL